MSMKNMDVMAVTFAFLTRFRPIAAMPRILHEQGLGRLWFGLVFPELMDHPAYDLFLAQFEDDLLRTAEAIRFHGVPGDVVVTSPPVTIPLALTVEIGV